MKKLGVDCGNTIFNEWTGVPLPGALDALRLIKESGRFEEIYLVSKANLFVRSIFRVRLRNMKFWERTGISPDKLYFCSRYKDKEGICKKLGITDFIDDRLTVLQYLNIKTRYAFDPKIEDFKNYPEVAKSTVVVRSWMEFSKLLK